MEKLILKSQPFICERNGVKHHFINTYRQSYRSYRTARSCVLRMERASSEDYLCWRAMPVPAHQSTFRDASEQLWKSWTGQEASSGKYTRNLTSGAKMMGQLSLKVTQRVACRITSNLKHTDLVADNCWTNSLTRGVRIKFVRVI